MATAALLGGSEAETERLFRDITSAAESGWDFSSRWMADGCSLASLRTTQVIPADLNAFLYKMECDMADFAEVSHRAPCHEALCGFPAMASSHSAHSS